MVYIKSKISDNAEIKIDLYDDEIYTQCPKCGREMQVETEILRELLKDGCLVGVSIYCSECSKSIEK